MGRSRELSQRQSLLALNALPGLGPVHLNRLLEAHGNDARAALAAAGGPAGDPAAEEAALEKMGGDYLVAGDPAYPGSLREIPDRPAVLYRKGCCDLSRPCVAIVGTRSSTPYGESVARRLAGEVAGCGFCVVSGLARGIDTAAHEGALAASGATAAVLGCGLDIVYPRENAALVRRIAEAGAILSEFPLGRPPDRGSFPMRNRIVSGMSAAVIVVESRVDGGAMITAHLAVEQGRTVFAVPGRLDQPMSAGCHRLIREGASLLTSVSDLLEELSYLDGLRTGTAPVSAGAARRPGGLGGDEKAVLAALGDGAALGPDALSARTGIGAASMPSALLTLEMKGLVVRRRDGTYERKVPG
jgi:DNA processing protein